MQRSWLSIRRLTNGLGKAELLERDFSRLCGELVRRGVAAFGIVEVGMSEPEKRTFWIVVWTWRFDPVFDGEDYDPWNSPGYYVAASREKALEFANDMGDILFACKEVQLTKGEGL